MDPLQRFCPSLDCPARGQVGQGNVTIHSQVEQRYRCSVCGPTFSEREGTVLSRLHTDPTLVLLVLTLVAHGCPLAAITAAFGFQARTVRAWIGKAGRHCEGVHAHLVEQPRDLGQVQGARSKPTRGGSSARKGSSGWRWRWRSPPACGWERSTASTGIRRWPTASWSR